MGGRMHDVMDLRKVAAPQDRPGARWMRLEDAKAAGVDLNGYESAIGPRRRGVVYYGAYWGDVSTVHDVFVRVQSSRDQGGMFAGRRAVGYEIAEECASDHGRVRRHMTSWEYDRRNQPLFMIGGE